MFYLEVGIPVKGIAGVKVLVILVVLYRTTKNDVKVLPLCLPFSWWRACIGFMLILENHGIKIWSHSRKPYVDICLVCNFQQASSFIMRIISRFAGVGFISTCNMNSQKDFSTHVPSMHQRQKLKTANDQLLLSQIPNKVKYQIRSKVRTSFNANWKFMFNRADENSQVLDRIIR